MAFRILGKSSISLSSPIRRHILDTSSEMWLGRFGDGG
jgi:hypothetical protein